MVRMNWRASASLTLITFAVSSVLLAQGVLAQLGMTEAAARKFLFDEIKSPALSRRNDIVVAGNRAFLKLPPVIRGQAASSLFAWAKAYVNSPAFKKIGGLRGETLTRVPRGFDKNHKAARYLVHKQFMGFREETGAFATSKDFYKNLVGTFKTLAPLVRFLNEPLIAAEAPSRKAHILEE